jgi:hypothetical protein
LRDGKTKTVSATLKGSNSKDTVISSNESLDQIYAKLGVSFAPLTESSRNNISILIQE